MNRIGSAILFGKIKDCMFIGQDISFKVLTDKKDYADQNYLFIGDLYFDEMHRPLFKLDLANATNILGDYYCNCINLNLNLKPLSKGVVFDAVINGTIVPLIIDCEIPEDNKEHMYKCELNIIEGAWTFILKGSDVMSVETFN